MIYLYVHVCIQVFAWPPDAYMLLATGRPCTQSSPGPFTICQKKQKPSACWELMENEWAVEWKKSQLWNTACYQHSQDLYWESRCEFVCALFLIGATCCLIGVSHKSRKLMLILCSWVICNLFPSIVLSGYRCSLLRPGFFPLSARNTVQLLWPTWAVWFNEDG